ncbi:DegT/DnrJ/EryC1/StrS family aminotransferase [Polymorphospora lycopeni]|uniref:DegT/DnrJ/EryC1/StrS family aminotransferase n=1 Tax=Polymorphospora lycopeni TaxID=3140240 RepID=A0ABV5CQM9_9ACTN
MTNIPLVDLSAAHAEVAGEIQIGFQRVIERTAFVGGEEVEEFEREYGAFNRIPHCIGTANGTDSLELALRAVGTGPGDEVILPANTFIATAEAVARIGARVVLVDVRPDSYLIDTGAVAAAVTRRTRAVVPVHLYGQLVPLEELDRRLAGLDVAVVEDAAQCQGATRFGRHAGAGGIAATSFYPGKNLGAYGDAGAVLCVDERLATRVRMLANHGGLAKYQHHVAGCNSRLDALQAVVLRAKLRRLAAGNAARRAAARRYAELLAGHDVVRPTTLVGNDHVWHLYVVRLPGRGAAARDAVVAELNSLGIGASVHYPRPIHRTPAFAGLGYGAGDFPAAEAAAREILSLPIYPQITRGQQEAVVGALAKAIRSGPVRG